MDKRLLIIGGGPKAMAIAAKASALKACGYAVPEIVIIEKSECAANWTGFHGYTDGQHTLGTLPEKDVGFPYFPFFGKDVVQKMAEQFSWDVFLVTHRDAWMDIGEWVDRGRNPPPHWVWARYFNWVKTKTQAQFIKGTVDQIGLKADRWNVIYFDGTQRVPTEVDGIVITGPGDARQINNQPTSERILNGKTFWEHLDRFQLPAMRIDEDPRQICVIGGGETAASILVELINRLDPDDNPIVLVNKQGMIFSRGENYFENSVYTYQDEIVDWKGLTREHRQQIVNHTDRGVFSLSSLSQINQARNIFMIAGGVDAIKISPNDPSEFHVQVENDGKPTTVPAHYVIVAIGFDPWSFKALLDSDVNTKLFGPKPDKGVFDKTIDGINDDLSAPWADASAEDLPRLHLPMLAGLAQGPGFPNLSCLGTLADRILKPYTA